MDAQGDGGTAAFFLTEHVVELGFAEVHRGGGDLVEPWWAMVSLTSAEAGSESGRGTLSGLHGMEAGGISMRCHSVAPFFEKNGIGSLLYLSQTTAIRNATIKPVPLSET